MSARKPADAKESPGPSRSTDRVATTEQRHGELLRALTVGLVDTFSKCSSGFGYSLTNAPRRHLTKVTKVVHNSGYDNAEHDYICRVGDKIENPDGVTYEILERLGHGTFGQVLKCQPMNSTAPVALKIIKNKPAYFHQALVEVKILQILNQNFDPEDDKRIVRMFNYFVYRKHLCISFELLSVNLYGVLKQNSYRGVSMKLIRVLTDQLLKAMRCLKEACVIHCDLKPENVLLIDMHHTKIKLIDFGSACFENHTVYPYIQSRFYRSPEVILGLPYTSAIDMWSLGCICAELFLGLPIFPGHSEYDQVCRVVEVLGLPPTSILDAGKNTSKYFCLNQDSAPSSEGSESEGEEPGDRELDWVVVSGPGDREPSHTSRVAEVLEGHVESHGQTRTEKVGSAGCSTDSPGSPARPPAEGSRSAEGPTSPPGGPGAPREELKSSHELLPPSAAAPDSLELSPEAETQIPAGSPTDVASSTSECGSLEEGPEGMAGDARKAANLPRRQRWRLKTKVEYERDAGKQEQNSKRYAVFKSLAELIELVPIRKTLEGSLKEEERERRASFLQFIQGLLQLNPQLRWTPQQATLHPFVTASPHNPDWQPPPDEKVTPWWAKGARSTPSASGTSSSGVTSSSGLASTGSIQVAAGPCRGTGPPGPPGRPVQRQQPGPGSQNGSRGSSPWHLPSPSEMSIMSERFNSSQPSGSDSCGEAGQHFECGHNDESTCEDPSGQSDRDLDWRRHSDSDCTTATSHDAAGGGWQGPVNRGVQRTWEHVPQLLTRDRMPRRLDMSSPGSAASLPDFRRAVGIQADRVAARRDAVNVVVRPGWHGPEGGEFPAAGPPGSWAAPGGHMHFGPPQRSGSAPRQQGQGGGQGQKPRRRRH